MSQVVANPITEVTESGARRKGLYMFGAICALIAIPIFLADTIISFTGGDANPAAMTAVDWFALFQANGLLGLRMLGMINIISLTVTIPMYLALYSVHNRDFKASTALAMMLYLVGVAIYISNNAAIPMFVLSGKYTLASTDTQRYLLAAAGEALIVKGADFTPGSFTGFIFTEIAGLAFSLITLRGRVFGEATALAGILGFSMLTVFTVCLTFFPAMFHIAMLIAMVGGLSSMAWYILVARRLLLLSREERKLA